MKVGRIIFALWAGLAAAALWAHDPGLSTAQAQVRADVIEVVVGLAPSDANQLLPASSRVDGKWTPAEFVGVQPLLAEMAPEMIELRVGGERVAPRETRVQLISGDALNFMLVFPRSKAETLTIRSVKLGTLPAGHREFMIVVDERGSTLAKKLLSAKDDTVAVTLGAVVTGVSAAATTGDAAKEPVEAPTFWGFLKLGVEHIWTGYDHLLFLFALLVVCRSFRSIVAIVSCFTLAHSLTLALATMEIVKLPGRIVEPAIAASIVFVGVENLWRRGEEPRGRWALTFVFGLIHGFGFATVLRELGVGQGGQGLAMPLFTFNLGVEVGQVIVAAAVLPIVWQLRKKEAFVRRGVPALSAIVALAGLYWLVERTMGK